jgi:hypothetical protein
MYMYMYSQVYIFENNLKKNKKNQQHSTGSQGPCYPWNDIEAHANGGERVGGVDSLEMDHTVSPFPPITRCE